MLMHSSGWQDLGASGRRQTDMQGSEVQCENCNISPALLPGCGPCSFTESVCDNPSRRASSSTVTSAPARRSRQSGQKTQKYLFFLRQSVCTVQKGVIVHCRHSEGNEQHFENCTGAAANLFYLLCVVSGPI